MPRICVYLRIRNLRTRTDCHKLMRNALILVFALATTIFANDSAPDKSQIQGITISTHGGGRD